MGSGASTVDDLRKKEGEIVGYHTQIDTLYKQIAEKANAVIKEIKRRQYNDPDLFCQRIVWYNIDELLPFMKTQTVPMGNYTLKYKPGVAPEKKIADSLNNAKFQTCKNIADFYKSKIFILEELAKAPTCQSMAKLEYTQLRKLLKSPADMDIPKWGKIYNELQSFNKKVIKDYTFLLKQVDDIRKTMSNRELGRLRSENLETFADIRNICQQHSAYFNTFVNNENQSSNRPATSYSANIVTTEEAIAPPLGSTEQAKTSKDATEQSYKNPFSPSTEEKKSNANSNDIFSRLK
jgi:hypothetical protein